MEVTPKKKQKRVYLITLHKSQDILLNLLENASFISEVRIGSPNILDEITESFLSSYDCIIYDLQDHGFLNNVITDKKKIDILERYIKNDRGSILVTHDHWDNRVSGPLQLIGLERNENFSWKVSETAKICRKHELFSCYNDLSNLIEMKIAPAHQTFSKIIENENNKARALMEFQLDIATQTRHNYLVVNELGLGRTAYWAAGHSNYISEDEKKLFLNIVAWLTKY